MCENIVYKIGGVFDKPASVYASPIVWDREMEGTSWRGLWSPIAC